MSILTYSIEIRVDTSDEGHEAMKHMIRDKIGDLRNAAMLISPQRPPNFACRVADAFYTEEELDLMVQTDHEVD